MSSQLPDIPMSRGPFDEEEDGDAGLDTATVAALSAAEPEPSARAANATVASADDKQIPSSYHGPLISSITVFLAFSLAFARYWVFEAPGDWTVPTAIAAVIVVVGLGLQVWSLYRALDLRDEYVAHYQTTVRIFFGGILVTVVGIALSSFLAV